MSTERVSDAMLRRLLELPNRDAFLLSIARDLLAARELLRELQYQGDGFGMHKCICCDSEEGFDCTEDCRLAALIGGTHG